MFKASARRQSIAIPSFNVNSNKLKSVLNKLSNSSIPSQIEESSDDDHSALSLSESMSELLKTLTFDISRPTIREYETKCCIAVIGSIRSGKEIVLSKECERSIQALESRIGIVVLKGLIKGAGL